MIWIKRFCIFFLLIISFVFRSFFCCVMVWVFSLAWFLVNLLTPSSWQNVKDSYQMFMATLKSTWKDIKSCHLFFFIDIIMSAYQIIYKKYYQELAFNFIGIVGSVVQTGGQSRKASNKKLMRIKKKKENNFKCFQFKKEKSRVQDNTGKITANGSKI